MKVIYRQIARDDVLRQFRYYLVTRDVPEIALRFREAVRKTIRVISAKPLIPPPCQLANRRLHNLRSWPVARFDSIRIYFLLENDIIQVVRILHGKRNIRAILAEEPISRK